MGYVVKDGKSIATKAGILAPGDEVTAEILGHNDDSGLEALAKKGVVGKKPGPKKKSEDKGDAGKD